MLGNIVGGIVLLGAIFVGGYYCAAGKLPSFLTGGEKAPQTVAQRPAVQWTNGNAGQTAAMPATNAPAGFSGQPQQQQREGGINININSSAAIENSKKSPEEIQSEKVKMQEELKKKQEEEKKKKEEEEKKKKEENLEIAYKPGDPNPLYSWTTEQKVNAPVKYHAAVIGYLEGQMKKITRERFSIGVTSKNFESELKSARKNERGCRAVLKKAINAHLKAEKDNEWPVYFAFREYRKEDFKIKVDDLIKKYRAAKRNVQRIRSANDTLQKRLRLHNQQFDHFEQCLEEYKQNLELIRSGKITESTLATIKKLDKAMNESLAFKDETLRKAEDTVFKPYVADEADAEANAEENYESILKELK